MRLSWFAVMRWSCCDSPTWWFALMLLCVNLCRDILQINNCQ